MLFTKKVPKLIFFNENFFRKIRMIFDIENSLWKSKIGTFWLTVTRWRLKIWLFHLTTVDSWPKTLPMPSVGWWNSTTSTRLLFYQLLITKTTAEELVSENWFKRSLVWRLVWSSTALTRKIGLYFKHQIGKFIGLLLSRFQKCGLLQKIWKAIMSALSWKSFF